MGYQKLLSLILVLVQRSRKAHLQNKNINLVRQMNSLLLLPIKHPSSNMDLQLAARRSQWQRANQFAYSGRRQPEVSLVYYLWASLVKQRLRYLRKTRRMKMNSSRRALSILLTRRERNLAKILSITTALIPLSSTFSTCTFSLHAAFVTSSSSRLSSYGNTPNSSSTEQFSCLVPEQALNVLITQTKASSGVLRFFSYSFQGSSLVTIMEPGLMAETSPGEGALPWCLFLMWVQRAGQLRYRLPQTQMQLRSMGSSRARLFLLGMNSSWLQQLTPSFGGSWLI